ncbi:MAG TPA: hypothetical protein DGZ24_08095 [Rhodospirillaceae bacterium]|nr:hypothetical protein [Rhodospirillaceae bacterium]
MAVGDDTGGDLTPEQLDQREKLLDMVREGIRLTAEEKEQLKELLQLQGRRLANLVEESAALEGQLGKYAKLKDSEDKRILMAQTAKDLAETNLRIAKQQLANAEEITPEMEKQLDTAQKNLKTATKNLEVAKGTTKAIQEGAAAGKELGAAMGSMFAAYGEHPFFNAKTMVNLGKVVRGLADKNMKPLDSLIGGMVGGSLAAIAGSFINLIFLVDETQSAFRRATGAGQEYADSLSSVYEQTRLYGVELKEVSSAMQSLYTTYTDFTMISKTQRDELTKTGALLQELGVTNEDFAQGVQTQTKMFGLSADAAAANSRELADFAQQIGVAPAQMGKDFATAGAGIAKLGDDGVRAFKQLAIVAKTTGLEINKLLQIVNKFDTFEGAADQAGKLNAALGGNFVNAMDLMTATDPVERFEMIRDSILNAGLSFDEMSYYQRLFYKDALGLDSVGDLALMLSGDMDKLAGATQQTTADYKRLEAESKAVMNVTEKFKALMMSLIPVANDLIARIQTFTTKLQNDKKMQKEWSDRIKMVTDTLVSLGEAIVIVADWWKWIVGLWAAFKVVGLLYKLGLVSTWFGTTMPAAAGTGSSAFTAASTTMAGGIQTVGTAATSVSGGLLTLSAVILAIGVSIAIASVGLAYLVTSFKGMGADGITAAVAIGLVAGAFYLMIPALSGLIAVGLPGAPVLWALAGAIVAMGLGVGIAAAGMALLATAVGGMFEHIDAKKVLALAGFVATAALLGTLLIPAAIGLGYFTAAMGVFGLALILFPTSDLEPITEFLTSVAAAGSAASNLSLVASAIREIGNEIELLPEMKDFQTTMRVVTEASNAVTNSAVLRSPAVAAAGMASNASTAAGNKDPYNVTVDFVIDGKKFGQQVFTLVDGKLKEGAYGQG